MTLLFWTIVAFSALGLMWLAKMLYDWRPTECLRLRLRHLQWTWWDHCEWARRRARIRALRRRRGS